MHITCSSSLRFVCAHIKLNLISQTRRIHRASESTFNLQILIWRAHITNNWLLFFVSINLIWLERFCGRTSAMETVNKWWLTDVALQCLSPVFRCTFNAHNSFGNCLNLVVCLSWIWRNHFDTFEIWIERKKQKIHWRNVMHWAMDTRFKSK